MSSINMDMSGFKELMKQMKGLGFQMDVILSDVVEELALETHNIAVTKIQSPPKTGRVYQKYNPRRTHQASAPGQYPAADTGSFGNSVKMELNTLDARVGTGDDRGPWFEFGTSKMKPRPWLLPSFDEAMIGVMDRLKAEIEARLK